MESQSPCAARKVARQSSEAGQESLRTNRRLAVIKIIVVAWSAMSLSCDALTPLTVRDALELPGMITDKILAANEREN
jgi:hypothetical protein